MGEAQAVREATREYREEEDPYIEFFTEVLCRGTGMESRVELRVAYEAYEDWHLEAGAPSLSDRAFAKQAEAHVFTKRKSNGKRYLLGGVLRVVRADECR